MRNKNNNNKSIQSPENGDFINSTKDSITDFAKSKVFDIMGLGFIVAMIALILGAVESKDVTWESFKKIIVEFVPFYIVAIALTMNYYTKGSYAGKATKEFTSIVTSYSKFVDNLTGHQIEVLPEYCKEYNENAIKLRQTTILKSVGISYEQFADGKDGKPPLKPMSYKELKSLYNMRIVIVIMKAQRVKVKGIHSNILLGNSQNKDITNLGKTEKGMAAGKTVKYAMGYACTIFFLTFITVKSILEWGWASLLFLGFKIVYVICRAYMRYFDGYRDITVSLSNHITRKTDILKSFDSWYKTNYKDGIRNETSNTNTTVQGN